MEKILYNYESKIISDMDRMKWFFYISLNMQEILVTFKNFILLNHPVCRNIKKKLNGSY